MSGKVCKYVDQKVISGQQGSAEDRFRSEERRVGKEGRRRGRGRHATRERKRT